MYANLVAAAGDGKNLEERDAFEAFAQHPFGTGFFGLKAADDHAVFVVGIAADREIDGA